jgi:NIMA-interacting peptidyl-prolyl cis-trans isomerase 1
MSHFKMPPWARAPPFPPGAATLTPDDNSAAPIDVSRQAAYVLGRGGLDGGGGGVDVALAPPSGHGDAELAALGVGRAHAAIVYHEEGGRAYAIDLASRGGVKLDGRALEPNKPARLRNGAALSFGALPRSYVFRCPEAAAGGPAQVAPAPQDTATATVRASHLLVKHRESRRPSSFREPVVTRSPDEARAAVDALRREIVARVEGGARLEEVFAEVAGRESHCSSARAGGDLGPFSRGQMQRAFDEATRALRVGEMSGAVASDSGVHLILRTA